MKYSINNNKFLILFTSGLLFLSVAFLAFSEQKQADPNTKNTWAIYFSNPKDQSLAFEVENHSSNETFNWHVKAGGEVLRSGTVNVANGKTTKTNVDALPAKGKVSVIVSQNKQQKEIYKILPTNN